MINWKLKRARVEAGYTQVELAKAAGVSRAALSDVERGHSPGSVRNLTKIARVLGVEVGDILPEAKSPDALTALQELPVEQRRKIIQLLVQRDLPDPDRQAYRQLRSMLLRVRAVGLRPAEFYGWYTRADVGEVLPKLVPEDAGAPTLRAELEAEAEQEQTLTPA